MTWSIDNIKRRSPPTWLQKGILLVLAFLTITFEATLYYNGILSGRTLKNKNKQTKNKTKTKNESCYDVSFVVSQSYLKYESFGLERLNLYKTNNTFVLSVRMTTNVLREFTYSYIFRLVKCPFGMAMFCACKPFGLTIPQKLTP